MKTPGPLRTLLLGIALILAIAGVTAWMTVVYPAVGIAFGGSAIALGLVYLTARFISRRPRDSFPPPIARQKGWFDLTPTTSLLLIGTILMCAAVVLALTESSQDVVVALVTVSGILIGVGLLWAIFSLAMTWLRRRTASRIVIGQISTVVRQNLPLATGLALAAESERGAARTNLRRISRFMAQGFSLSEAIRYGFPDCPSLPLSLIIAGERAGQLPAALEQAEQHLIDRAQRHDRIDISVWPYLMIIMLFMSLIVAGIMVTVIPKFKEIFKDFGVEMPAMTLRVIAVCAFLAESGLLAILSIFILLALPIGLYLNIRQRRIPQPAWTSRAADWIRWHVPGWRTMEFGSSMAAMLRTMRLGVRAGMDIEPAARLAADIDVNSQLRPRISRFADLLASGTNIRAAVRQAGLGEVTAVALAGGQRSGNLDAGLRFAADYHDALVNRFWIVLRNLAWPLCTLGMGLLVGAVVFALFQPLVVLINSVAGGQR